MTQAARLNDPIGHSPSMNWLLKGVVAGAAIALGTVAIVGTGGLGAAAIVGGLAAGGAGIGEMMSTMSWAPKEVCGVIKGACSGDVYINGIPAARAHVDVVDCHKHSPPYPPIATGSATVFINGQPAARVDDKVGCSAVLTVGSNNVFIGGDTVQTDVLHPENLVPAGVHAALLIAGVGSAIVLGGPIVAAAGLVGGAAGQVGGEWIGGTAFGVESDGQKWTMLGGSLLGGILGAKGGAIAGKWNLQSTVATRFHLQEGLTESFEAQRATGGLRRPANLLLDNAEIQNLTQEFTEVGGDPAMLRFNRGAQTSYVDELDIINVRGDVLPIEGAMHPRSSMSSRAVLAHELGHSNYRGTKLEPGAWNDEFRASYWAAKKAPGLTEMERIDLLNDAIMRAREAGVSIKLNNFMKETLYGY